MSRLRVFIVDDHQMVREGLAELLTKSGKFEVVGEAADGREALQSIKEAAPNIVFLDISMPNLNGLAVLGQLKKAWPSGKIIVLTMHDRGSYVAKALSQGASGYLLKDLSSSELFRAVECVQRGGVYLAEDISQSVIREYVDLAKQQQYKTPSDALTSREMEVFQLVVEGNTSNAIARQLCISCKTVEHHRHSVMDKLSCSNTTELIRFAAREGIIKI